jgi:hypothetical protein
MLILDVIDCYDISSKLHCFVSDNATSNDGELIRGLNLYPNINLTFDERLRCCGHIFNLIVKTTLYGKGIHKWKEELAAAAPRDQFEKFPQLGVVGKLHNFVNAVCASHKRCELFTSLQKEAANDNDVLYTHSTLSLRQDCGVRWHPVYLIMLRCVELRDYIQRFVYAAVHARDAFVTISRNSSVLLCVYVCDLYFD